MEALIIATLVFAPGAIMFVVAAFLIEGDLSKRRSRRTFEVWRARKRLGKLGE